MIIFSPNHKQLMVRSIYTSSTALFEITMQSHLQISLQIEGYVGCYQMDLSANFPLLILLYTKLGRG